MVECSQQQCGCLELVSAFVHLDKLVVISFVTTIVEESVYYAFLIGLYLFHFYSHRGWEREANVDNFPFASK